MSDKATQLEQKSQEHCLIISCFVLFDCNRLYACSVLKIKWKGVNINETGGREGKRIGGRRNCGCDTLCERRICFQKKKETKKFWNFYGDIN